MIKAIKNVSKKFWRRHGQKTPIKLKPKYQAQTLPAVVIVSNGVSYYNPDIIKTLLWDKSEFTISNKKVKLTVSVKNNLTLTFDPCEMCPELLTLLTLLSRYVDIKKVEQLMLEEFQNVKLNA